MSDKNKDVQEKSFLVFSDDYVGVTDSLKDICKLIEDNSEGNQQYTICTGYKDELLDFQQKILLKDEFLNFITTNDSTLKIMEKFTEYNLTKRKKYEKITWQNFLER